jgi:hypothetical protein
MRNMVATIAITFGVIATPVAVVQATPMIFGANAYEFVSVADPFTGSNNTWATASSAAAASVFNGIHGHLATVTSQAENNFLVSLVVSPSSGFNGAWLGGNFQGWLEGPEGGMTFAEAGGFTNWNPIEPNNSGLMYMSIGTTTPNGGSAGKWFDDSGTNGLPEVPADPVIGYFIEYENAAAAVPEPATSALLLAGLPVLLAVRRLAGGL